MWCWGAVPLQQNAVQASKGSSASKNHGPAKASKHHEHQCLSPMIPSVLGTVPVRHVHVHAMCSPRASRPVLFMSGRDAVFPLPFGHSLVCECQGSHEGVLHYSRFCHTRIIAHPPPLRRRMSNVGDVACTSEQIMHLHGAYR